MARMMPVARKLIAALGTKDIKITLSTKQFIGKEGNSHDFYSINEAVWDAAKGKYMHYELYSSVSQVRIVLFLRDMWYEANGWDLPMDQPLWNSIRADLRSGKKKKGAKK